ncbi:M64 family metallopeptidase, partial [candidate division KSB1 bacterium]
IYSRGYSTLFNEWQTTDEAQITWKSFSESIIFPYPRNPVIVEFFGRKSDNTWVKKYEIEVNPSNYFIKTERIAFADTFNIHYSGNPNENLDIVIISEGYTHEEMEKFIEDAARFAGYILNCDPFLKYKDYINIWGVKAISHDSGTDLPGKNIWKNTALNSSFYTFDSERYLTTTDYKSVRDYASNVPYDQIVIIVNTKKYGGGGIFNFFSLTSSDHQLADFLITHEFGHGFAGLADEYYTSDVSYEEFYNLTAEPWEPNITTLINFENKWKYMLAKDTPVPTPAESQFSEIIGVFEGGGYVPKGVFRPYIDCTMKSTVYNSFCPVCLKTIEKMIKFYSR